MLSAKEAEQYNRRVLEELDTIISMRGRNIADPVRFLEMQYLQNAKKFVKTGVTPKTCKAIQTSCFIDSWGNVFPCIIYSKVLGNLRDNDYDITKILDKQETKRVMKEVMMLKCPNCWTPCEAYQAIMANMFSLF